MCGCKNEINSKFCTNCGNPIPIADERNTGKIIVRRKQKLLAFAIPFEVYIDDTKLGTLKNGDELSCSINYGKHELKVVSFEKDVVQNIELTSLKKL